MASICNLGENVYARYVGLVSGARGSEPSGDFMNGHVVGEGAAPMLLDDAAGFSRYVFLKSFGQRKQMLHSRVHS